MGSSLHQFLIMVLFFCISMNSSFSSQSVTNLPLNIDTSNMLSLKNFSVIL